MLTETEIKWFAAVINRLQADGMDVSALKLLLKKERAKINALMTTDLIDYFPIKQEVIVKLNCVDYGKSNLGVNMCLVIPRESGVFDKNSAPELFEATLINAISECLKKLKDEFKEEAEKLKEQVESDMITASHDHPIKLTIGTITLYCEEGTIDKSLNWEVDHWDSSIKDITLKAGTIIKTLRVTTGDYVDTGVHTVVVTQE